MLGWQTELIIIKQIVSDPVWWRTEVGLSIIPVVVSSGRDQPPTGGQGRQGHIGNTFSLVDDHFVVVLPGGGVLHLHHGVGGQHAAEEEQEMYIIFWAELVVLVCVYLILVVVLLCCHSVQSGSLTRTGLLSPVQRRAYTCSDTAVTPTLAWTWVITLLIIIELGFYLVL